MKKMTETKISKVEVKNQKSIKKANKSIKKCTKSKKNSNVLNSDKPVKVLQEKDFSTKHFVYILECSDGTYYTGWTTNLEKRINAHNTGKGAKYTRGRTPVKMVYFEELNSKCEALSREFAIKKLKRNEKELLIK